MNRLHGPSIASTSTPSADLERALYAEKLAHYTRVHRHRAARLCAIGQEDLQIMARRIMSQIPDLRPSPLNE